MKRFMQFCAAASLLLAVTACNGITIERLQPHEKPRAADPNI